MTLNGTTTESIMEHFWTNDPNASHWTNQSNITDQSGVGNTENTGDISNELTDDITFAFECVTMPILVIFGITGNVLSLVVLLHRRLRRSSTTVLLIGLAVSDCLYLIATMVRKSTCIISRFDAVVSYRYFVLSFSAVFYTSTCLSRISTLLVAVISVERLIAVTLPLKVKLLCTKTRMAIAVVVVFLFTGTFLVLLPLHYEVSYRNDTPYLKQTTFVTENEEFLDIYNQYIIVTVFRLMPKVIVVMCNGIIITKLWRRRIPSENMENTSSMHNNRKQRKITVMLVTVAIVFVITLLPGDAFWITSLIVDEFTLYGKYRNYFSVLSDVTLTFELINASVNFVIYMVLNSSFSDVYLALFCHCHSSARLLPQTTTSSQVLTRDSTRKEGEQRSHLSASNVSETNLSSISYSLDSR